MRSPLYCIIFIAFIFTGCNKKITTDFAKPQIIITNDGEVDDQNAFIRFLLYSNEFDVKGLVYSSSQWHYSGDGKGTLFTSGMPNTAKSYGERTELRWTGTEWMQGFIDLYAESYDNLLLHDNSYPKPEYLKSIIRVGNIEFEGEMDKITDGSELIRKILLDDNPDPVYVQVWGGTNTLARALKCIEEKYKGTDQWQEIYNKVVNKTIVYIILNQDVTFLEYILPNWPDIKTIFNRSQPRGFAYSWRRLVPEELHALMDGEWYAENILFNRGPLLKRYYTYDDGQPVEGDYMVKYHDFELSPHYAERGHIRYDFISEWDSPAWLYCLDFRFGLRNEENPSYGGLGGRFVQSEKNPNVWADVWEDVPTVKDINPFTGEWDAYYPQLRWIPVLQNDFAARAEWCVKNFQDSNHAPVVRLNHPAIITAKAGDMVRLKGTAKDPDGYELTYTWWQYKEAGTYSNDIIINDAGNKKSSFTVPSDTEPGDTIHVILEVKDSGTPALTGFQRVIITVI